jgi:uncharacterized protein (UPF0332 family)
MEYSEKTVAIYRLNKAREDLSSAKELCNSNSFAQSINRSYYTIFHSARALMAFDRFDSKKHSSIISFFNQNYCATGKIEEQYGKMLSGAFNIRIKSDYQDFYIASKGDAELQLKNAEEFLKMVENNLSNALEK